MSHLRRVKMKFFKPKINHNQIFGHCFILGVKTAKRTAGSPIEQRHGHNDVDGPPHDGGEGRILQHPAGGRRGGGVHGLPGAGQIYVNPNPRLVMQAFQLRIPFSCTPPPLVPGSDVPSLMHLLWKGCAVCFLRFSWACFTSVLSSLLVFSWWSL